jgi:uncharacterized protein YkwD
MRLEGLILIAGFAVGCNLVTGADGMEIVDDFGEEDDGSTSQSGATSGAGGAAAATTGSGETATTGTGATGASTVGAGGATTTAASGATTGSGMSSGSGTTTSGGGENCGGSGPGTTPLDSEEQAFVTIINDYRAQNSLGPLTPCISLNRAAQGHSEDMRDQNYFDHTNLAGDDPFDRMCNACFDLACGTQTAMGENIAAGNSDAQATFEQWRTSPGHNANMLNSSFNYIGIGRATGGGQYGTYWTNVFAGDDEASCY